MPQEIHRLGVLAQRRPPVTRWGKGEMRPMAALSAEPETAPHTCIASDTAGDTWYIGARDLVFWSGVTAHYRDNLVSGRPSIWVALRGTDPASTELVQLTVDPYEGEGLAADLDLIVEPVPMPAPLRDALQAFVARHHVEEEFKKRKRLPADPNAMTARAPRILPADDGWIARRGKGPQA